MTQLDDQAALWRCDDFGSALDQATDVCDASGEDIGIWSFERRWGRTFYVAPIGTRVRFAAHLCRVVEAEPWFVSLDDLAA